MRRPPARDEIGARIDPLARFRAYRGRGLLHVHLRPDRLLPLVAMALVGQIAAIPVAASEGSFLVSPSVGLMIWTIVLFLITMWVLSKVAFPKIQEALDKRAKTIAESIDAAERQRKESDELFAEYPSRLTEAREQADEIMSRARKAADTAESEATAAGRGERDEVGAQAERGIAAETPRS